MNLYHNGVETFKDTQDSLSLGPGYTMHSQASIAKLLSSSMEDNRLGLLGHMFTLVQFLIRFNYREFSYSINNIKPEKSPAGADQSSFNTVCCFPQW